MKSLAGLLFLFVYIGLMHSIAVAMSFDERTLWYLQRPAVKLLKSKLERFTDCFSEILVSVCPDKLFESADRAKTCNSQQAFTDYVHALSIIPKHMRINKKKVYFDDFLLKSLNKRACEELLCISANHGCQKAFNILARLYKVHEQYEDAVAAWLLEGSPKSLDRAACLLGLEMDDECRARHFHVLAGMENYAVSYAHLAKLFFRKAVSAAQEHQSDILSLYLDHALFAEVLAARQGCQDSWYRVVKLMEFAESVGFKAPLVARKQACERAQLNYPVCCEQHNVKSCAQSNGKTEAAEDLDAMPSESLLESLKNSTNTLTNTIEKLSKKAFQGESSSRVKLAYCYRFGFGVPRSSHEALLLYKKALISVDSTLTSFVYDQLKKMGCDEYCSEAAYEYLIHIVEQDDKEQTMSFIQDRFLRTIPEPTTLLKDQDRIVVLSANFVEWFQDYGQERLCKALSEKKASAWYLWAHINLSCAQHASNYSLMQRQLTKKAILAFVNAHALGIDSLKIIENLSITLAQGYRDAHSFDRACQAMVLAAASGSEMALNDIIEHCYQNPAELGFILPNLRNKFYEAALQANVPALCFLFFDAIGSYDCQNYQAINLDCAATYLQRLFDNEQALLWLATNCPEQGKRLLIRALETGDLHAYYILGMLSLILKNYELAYKYLTVCAKHGDPHGLFEVARMAQQKLFPDANDKVALDYYEQALQSAPPSLQKMIRFYLDQYVKDNHTEAVWLLLEDACMNEDFQQMTALSKQILSEPERFLQNIPVSCRNLMLVHQKMDPESSFLCGLMLAQDSAGVCKALEYIRNSIVGGFVPSRHHAYMIAKIAYDARDYQFADIYCSQAKRSLQSEWLAGLIALRLHKFDQGFDLCSRALGLCNHNGLILPDVKFVCDLCRQRQQDSEAMALLARLAYHLGTKIADTAESFLDDYLDMVIDCDPQSADSFNAYLLLQMKSRENWLSNAVGHCLICLKTTMPEWRKRECEYCLAEAASLIAKDNPILHQRINFEAALIACYKYASICYDSDWQHASKYVEDAEVLICKIHEIERYKHLYYQFGIFDRLMHEAKSGNIDSQALLTLIACFRFSCGFESLENVQSHIDVFKEQLKVKQLASLPSYKRELIARACVQVALTVIGLEKEFQNAKIFFEHAFELCPHNEDIKCMLAKCYIKLPEKKFFLQGVHILEELAGKNHYAACNVLSELYLNGYRSINKCLKTTLTYLSKSLKGNNLSCIKLLTNVLEGMTIDQANDFLCAILNDDTIKLKPEMRLFLQGKLAQIKQDIIQAISFYHNWLEHYEQLSTEKDCQLYCYVADLCAVMCMDQARHIETCNYLFKIIKVSNGFIADLEISEHFYSLLKELETVQNPQVRMMLRDFKRVLSRNTPSQSWCEII